MMAIYGNYLRFFIFSIGASTLYALNQGTVTLQSSKDKPKSKPVASYKELDLTNLNEVTNHLQGQNIEILEVVGSPGIRGISNDPMLHHPLSYMPTLKSLNLSNNSITFESRTEINAFFYSTNLIGLNLSYNNISSTGILMQALKPLKNLQSLYLNNNRKLNFEHGETFPAELRQLEFLDLSYCHILHLNDHVFMHLLNLKTLHLEGNDLSLIPASLCSRPSSMQIYLARTHIDASYQKLVEEECTAKISFVSQFSGDKHNCIWDGWYHLALASSFISASSILYFFYEKKKTVIYEWFNCR